MQGERVKASISIIITTSGASPRNTINIENPRESLIIVKVKISEAPRVLINRGPLITP